MKSYVSEWLTLLSCKARGRLLRSSRLRQLSFSFDGIVVGGLVHWANSDRRFKFLQRFLISSQKSQHSSHGFVRAEAHHCILRRSSSNCQSIIGQGSIQSLRL